MAAPVSTRSNRLQAMDRRMDSSCLTCASNLALETRLESIYREYADAPMPHEVAEAARSFDAAGTETLLIESKIDDGRTLTICLAPGVQISARIE